MESFYSALVLPSFAPPAWIFGPVWTVLYILIFLSFGWTLLQVIRKRFPHALLPPFAINLIANLLWTPLFFRWQNFDLALLDIILVWGSILWIMKSMWNRARWVSLIQIPYFLWVSFAGMLMISVWWMN